MGATTAAVVTIAALAGGYKAYSEGQQERSALKQQYKLEEYNAQMDKMETEVDLARQEKLLQKQLAQTMAAQNNLFGEVGLNPNSGSAGNLLNGTFIQGQNETRAIQNNLYNTQNKYIYNEAIRRKTFNKNLKNNRINTLINTGVTAAQYGAMAYSGMASAGFTGSGATASGVTQTGGGKASTIVDGKYMGTTYW